MYIGAVFYLLGYLLAGFGVAMMFPIFIALYHDEHTSLISFLSSFIISVFLGGLLIFSNKKASNISLQVREAFLFTSSSWVSVSLVACLPFYFSDYDFGIVNALFESVSALTTTGATVITDLSRTPKSILLWRNLLQWFGGIGIVIMAMTILPILKIGGMQLMYSESSERSEKILPKTYQIALILCFVYIFLTFLCFLGLFFAGMDLFDAVCHAFGTVSTGGLSTKNNSIAYYDSFLIELIMIIFMSIGGTPLILYLQFWKGNYKAIFSDSQVRTFLILLIISISIITSWQFLVNNIDFLVSLRQSSFTVVSLMTTAGYTTADYTLWGSLPTTLIFLISMIGGCSGSTTGAIKIYRFQILFMIAISHLRSLRRPHGVFVPLFRNKKIDNSVSTSVLTFITLYFFCLLLLACGLAIYDLDIVTCLSAAAASIGNVGPALGNLIGPTGTYFTLPNGAKFLLMLGMILGRLELLTVIILFMPSFWKR